MTTHYNGTPGFSDLPTALQAKYLKTQFRIFIKILTPKHGGKWSVSQENRPFFEHSTVEKSNLAAQK